MWVKYSSAVTIAFLILSAFGFRKFRKITTGNDIRKKIPESNKHTILLAHIVDGLNMDTVLFVETGFGCDQHGQNSTKAAVRACRNAIEFNSIPSIRKIIPGGRDNMIIRLQIATPDPNAVNVNALADVFPYGKLMKPEVMLGGMKCSSGIALPELGDKNDDMYIAVAVITIGY
jgi:uncharacterized protein (TIGR02058 family)